MKGGILISSNQNLRRQACRSYLGAATRRYLSSAQPKASNHSPPSIGFAHLTNRALISVQGRDAAHFLQGLTTSNIKTSTASSQLGFYSAFLNAQGRVLHDAFIYPLDRPANLRTNTSEEKHEDSGFLVDVDSVHAKTLHTHLKRFKLRAKISLRLVDDGEWSIWSMWGQNEAQLEDSARLNPRSIECKDTRAPDMGHRLILYNGQKPQATTGKEVAVESYEIRRILKGVPQGHDEIISGEALPQESNIDYMGGIDFRKGCYVGQELTIRTRHTGVVRKRILPVQVYGMDDEPPHNLQYDPGSSFSLPTAAQNIGRVNTRGRSAGKWLKGIGNVGLALCRLETMTDMRLTEEASQYSPEQEFKMSWQPDGTAEAEMKIKAFVPEWHKDQITR